MVIYFMPIPIITSIVGISLTLAFHNNYAEYQSINSLYKMEQDYANHQFIFYKNKTFNYVISKYNNLNGVQKRKFIEDSLRLGEYPNEQKVNVPYFKEASLNSIKNYVSLIRDNQTLSYWNKFKHDNIENYLYFKWTAFSTANYLEKITKLNFVNASTSGFISGTIVLSFSILGVVSILVYYYFSKKNGYIKDMQELGYDVSVKYGLEEKVKFKEENKMSLREKMDTIDVLSKNKEVIDFQNKNSNLGFKNKFLQQKDKIQNNIPTTKINNDFPNRVLSSRPNNGLQNNIPTTKINNIIQNRNPTVKISNGIQNGIPTSRIRPMNIINRNEHNTRKIDLENTKKIDLFQKKIHKLNKKSKKTFLSKKK